MTFQGSSFGDDYYDKSHYYCHFEDEDGDFTVDGPAREHTPERTVYYIESVEPMSVASFKLDLEDGELEALLERGLEIEDNWRREYEEFLADQRDLTKRFAEVDRACQPGYVAGTILLLLLFVALILTFLAVVGLGVYALTDIV